MRVLLFSHLLLLFSRLVFLHRAVGPLSLRWRARDNASAA
jgi:hypothetical protein